MEAWCSFVGSVCVMTDILLWHSAVFYSVAEWKAFFSFSIPSINLNGSGERGMEGNGEQHACLYTETTDVVTSILLEQMTCLELRVAYSTINRFIQVNGQ